MSKDRPSGLAHEVRLAKAIAAAPADAAVINSLRDFMAIVLLLGIPFAYLI
jgi:hypothetical protein